MKVVTKFITSDGVEFDKMEFAKTHARARYEGAMKELQTHMTWLLGMIKIVTVTDRSVSRENNLPSEERTNRGRCARAREGSGVEQHTHMGVHYG